MRRLLIAGATLAALAAPAGAVEDTTPLPNVKWSFSGPFGTFDRAAAQRGFQVYNEVCSACHSMRLLSYRDLEKIGLTTAQIKAIAATKTVAGPEDDEGKPTTRPGLASDHFVSPFPNDKAARAANNGALPPDQSLIEKAREGGSTYIYALVGHGYIDPPAGVKVPDGLYYNQYFPGHNIHMPPPLSDGSVTYADGTKATIDQEARDVATFSLSPPTPKWSSANTLASASSASSSCWAASPTAPNGSYGRMCTRRKEERKARALPSTRWGRRPQTPRLG